MPEVCVSLEYRAGVDPVAGRPGVCVIVALADAIVEAVGLSQIIRAVVAADEVAAVVKLK